MGGDILYHATSWSAACSIDSCQEFQPGKGGYAGPAMYFSVSEQTAGRLCFNGRGGAEIVIKCRVRLGRTCVEERNIVNREKCSSEGYDSWRHTHSDTLAVFEPDRISILGFKHLQCEALGWHSSMQELHQARCRSHIKEISQLGEGTSQAQKDIWRLWWQSRAAYLAIPILAAIYMVVCGTKRLWLVALLLFVCFLVQTYIHFVLLPFFVSCMEQKEQHLRDLQLTATTKKRELSDYMASQGAEFARIQKRRRLA
eukprot:TRINITY_DN30468_c0_g1_i1.p1 TRINITY_DN30468_c0_g1~~TRINITY_DN30468_c0_g1_i1.p1  ORF type:complete len:256 (-),score=28.62 TRINITY_DN30468_c0_g1_i1:119-886(-)